MLVIGHRGAAKYKSENTAASFLEAIKLGAKMLEFDLRRCKSGEIIVIHDDAVERTTNGSGRVSDLTLKELKKLDAGDGERIITFEELLDVVDKKAAVNLEVKESDLEESICNIIKKYVSKKQWKLDDFLVSSFYYKELPKYKKIIPDLKIAAAVDKNISPMQLDYFANNQFYSVHPCKDFILKGVVNQCHRHNIKVYCWTVNNLDDYQRLNQMGVDGVFTDDLKLFHIV